MLYSDKVPFAFYSDQLSCHAGDDITLHISAVNTPCTVRFFRRDSSRVNVLTLDSIATVGRVIPDNASSAGCNWPASIKCRTSAHWASGYYEIELEDSIGQLSHHFIVIKANQKARQKNALIVASNTYHAYNYWGGRNAYADVYKLMSGELDVAQASDRATGVLSTQRPFAPNIVNLSEEAPRLVNLRKREMHEQPFAVDPSFMPDVNFSPFDGSAGFVNKWEHAFVKWAHSINLPLDCLLDQDAEQASALEGYKNLFVVGHSEYWSQAQRDQIDAFVLKGGNLVILSGNTCYWKVRHEDDCMISHKMKGEENDPLWSIPEKRCEATHAWSHPEFNNPETSTIGLSFLYGGYHRLGNAVSRGQAGYTVIAEGHWALAGTDLFYGDVFGDELPLIGYESDGCPLQYDHWGRLCAKTQGGVPDSLEVIAYAPATLVEPDDTGYAPIIPPEELATLARFRFGESSPDALKGMKSGNAVVASFKKGHGEVFNAGNTEWVHGLQHNQFVQAITMNVLKRFNAF